MHLSLANFLTLTVQKEVGAWNYLQIMEGLEGFTYALFTRQLGYTQKEVEVICANIRKEMKDPKMHAMFHLYVFGYYFPPFLSTPSFLFGY